MLCCFEEHLEPLAFSVPQMFPAAVAAVRLPLSTEPASETEAWYCFLLLSLSVFILEPWFWHSPVHMEVLRRWYTAYGIQAVWPNTWSQHVIEDGRSQTRKKLTNRDRKENNYEVFNSRRQIEHGEGGGVR